MNGWTRCGQGHRHWGRAGAAGLLIHRPGARGLELLLQRRAAWTDHGGTWGLPGGALHPGEAATAAAVREAGEELGIPSDAVAVGAELVDDHDGWAYTTVLAQPTRPIDPADLWLSSESTAAAWWPLEGLEVSARLHPGLAGSLPRVGAALALAELHAALFGGAPA